MGWGGESQICSMKSASSRWAGCEANRVMRVGREGGGGQMARKRRWTEDALATYKG